MGFDRLVTYFYRLPQSVDLSLFVFCRVLTRPRVLVHCIRHIIVCLSFYRISGSRDHLRSDRIWLGFYTHGLYAHIAGS